jgi:hypothetical protein
MRLLEAHTNQTPLSGRKAATTVASDGLSSTIDRKADLTILDRLQTRYAIDERAFAGATAANYHRDGATHGFKRRPFEDWYGLLAGAVARFEVMDTKPDLIGRHQHQILLISTRSS